VNHFVEKFAVKMGKDISGVSDGVLDVLMRYDFPGNVRELENIIEHGVVISGGGMLEERHLPRSLLEKVGGSSGGRASFREEVTESEKKIIDEALKKYHGNRILAARSLNMNRTTLWRKMKKYGLMVEGE
jgi:transcriptional regulator with PAS, ATPase and Fis domain